jgi:hypothetical protein
MFKDVALLAYLGTPVAKKDKTILDNVTNSRSTGYTMP